MHKHDQFHFSITNAKVVWSHVDQTGAVVFNVTTTEVVQPRQWIHLVATYDSQPAHARVYLDGGLVLESNGRGQLSQDWGRFAGIGKHFYEGTTFKGMMDEFYMFNYELEEEEIEYLANRSCE